MLVIYMFRPSSYIDPLSYVFILLGLAAIASNKTKLLYVSVFVGMLAKETILLVVGVYFVYNWLKFNLYISIRKTLSVGFVAIIPYFAVRFWYGFESYYTTSIFIDTIRSIIERINSNASHYLGKIYSIFGSLWLIFFLAIKTMKRKIHKTLAIAFIPILLQIVIGTGTARLLFLAFPVIIPIAMSYILYNTSLSMLIFSYSLITGVFALISGTFLFVSGPNGTLPWIAVSLGLHELVICYFYIKNEGMAVPHLFVQTE
jgi:hypothetical protein